MTHRSQRFDVYTELPDGSGFTIPNCKFIFRYDRNGGWQDQNGNHYYSDGTPNYNFQNPFDDENESDQNKSSQKNGDYQFDAFDAFDKEYAYGNQQDQNYNEYDDEELRNLEKIEINNQIIKLYPENKPLRVYYNNMDYTYNQQTIIKYLKQYCNVSLVVRVDQQYGRRNGKGHFIIKNKNQAKQIVALEGKLLGKRHVYYQVETIQQLALYPVDEITLRELGIHNTNKFIQKISNKPENKTSKQQQQIIKQNKLINSAKEQKKQIQKIQSKKQQKKQEEVIVQNKEKKQTKVQQEWSKYSFDITLFKNGDEFRNWTKTFNIVFDRDYRNTKKLGTTGTLESPKSTIQILRQHKWNNQLLKFTEVKQSKK